MTNPAPDPGTPQGSNQSGLDATQNAGSAQAQRTTELRSLAMALAQDDSDQVNVLKGVVTAVFLTTDPQTLAMNLSGDQSVAIAGVRFLDSYTPTVGDTVLVVKFGGELFALGKFQQVRAHAANGWVAPSLSGSSWTTDSNDPVMYRLVVDHGSTKIQLRGRVYVVASAALIWTMPTGFRPLFDIGPMVIARGYGGGSVAAQLEVQASGAMNLVGATAAAGSASPGTGSPSANVTSWEDAGIGGSPGTFNNTPDTGTALASPNTHSHFIGGHQHNLASHTHTVNSHTHAVTFPDWISFNGIEYFI